MGTIKSFLSVTILLLGLYSCSLLGINDFLDRGYIDSNNQYTPKRPRFKLKDKPNNIIPSNLDLINVYKLHQRYYQGKISPSPDDKYSELNKVKIYQKFYSNGRCLGISISSKDDFGNDNSLQESDLNPNNPNYRKKYYYCKDSKVIRIENFVYGEGYGMYVMFDYFLNAQGDTLTMIYENSKEIYVKEILPINWRKYNIDW